jgi:oligopeptide transport system substrate-binding protein
VATVRTRAGDPSRWRAAIGLVTVIGLVLGAACTSDDSSSPSDTTEGSFQQGGDLRLAAVDVTTLDPAAAVPTNQAQMIAIDLLYDSITVFPNGLDPTDQNDVAGGMQSDEVAAEPDLAQSITPNADATVWTVALADRTFSDGSAVQAADVKATYERLAKKGSASLAGVRLDIVNGYAEAATGGAAEVSGLRVVDARTLEITLREPYRQLPELLASPLFGIAPKASVDAGDAAFAEPVSSGPYAFVGKGAEGMTFERSSSSTGADAGPNTVEMVTFPSWGDAYAAFTAGEVDWSLVPSDQLVDASDTYGDEHFTNFGSELWFGFNLSDSTFGDIRFRQAIVQAVDSAKVVADALPGRFPLRAIVPRDVPGYDNDACANLCEASPEVAKAWLTQAFPDGAIPTVTLDGYDDPTQAAMLNSVKAQLEAVGIPVQIRTRPFSEYRSFATSGQQAVFSFGWVGIAPTQDVYLASLFRTSSPDNVTGFRSDEIDAQLAAARAEPDAQKRQEAYAWIERQILSQSVIIPIAQLRTNQVVADRVQGWSTRLDGTYVVPGVWLAE